MNDPITFPQKKRKRICDKYPSAIYSEVPKVYELNIIEYKKEEIELYPVVVWHRFLKKYYGQPTDIETFLCEAKDGHPISDSRLTETVIFRVTGESTCEFLNISKENLEKYKSGEVTMSCGDFINWKYFIKLPSENIVVIGTKEIHRVLFVSLIKQKDNIDKKNNITEVKKFISYILEEIKKQNNNLFNPKNLMREGATSYFLWNGYLSNYTSANHMLNIAKKEEDKLTKELYRYDDKTTLSNTEALNHTEVYTLVCGTYFASAISYFFMAFEGFVNIIYHAFIKNDLSDLNIEKGLNLEQKIRFLTSLCDGFKRDDIATTSDVHEEFKKLTKYRNKLFHSKVEDSLASLLVIDDSFFYNYHMDQYKNEFLPSCKAKLQVENVIKVKNIIDKMIQNILFCMEEEIKKPTENYILKSSQIPFICLGKGKPLMGGGGF